MKIKAFASRLLLAPALAFGACVATAQPPKSTPATKAAAEKAAAFDRKRFDDLRAEGFDALYNLDYEGARRRFTEMTKAFPDHPAGFQFLAVGLWLKTLNESRRLQTSLYNNDGFYKEKDDRVDPKASDKFRSLTLKTKELCEARLKQNPKDV